MAGCVNRSHERSVRFRSSVALEEEEFHETLRLCGCTFPATLYNAPEQMTRLMAVVIEVSEV